MRVRAADGKGRRNVGVRSALLAFGLAIGLLPGAAPATAVDGAANGAIAFQLFTTDCRDFCTNFADLYVTDVDATEPPLLLPGSAERYDAVPDWSPDGNRIVFTGYPFGVSYTDIYTMDADGGNLQRLTNNHANYEPKWSPDGAAIAYTRTDTTNSFPSLWLMDADGANKRQVRGDYVTHSIAWLPDGRLTFWGFGNNFGDPSNPPNGLYVADTAGTEVELLLTLDELSAVTGEPMGFPLSMDWSASGTGLFAARVPMEGVSACENRIPYQEDLFNVQADGSGVQRVVATAGEADLWEGSASWSPDGSAIAFEAYAHTCVGEGRDAQLVAGPNMVYTMSATGADRQQLVEPPLPEGMFVYAQDPAWQPCTAATERCGRPEGTGSFPTDPEPEPEPSPSPDPEPTPSPDPEPSPSPDPEPSPSPDPEPSPGPDPEPEPGPAADACPPGGVPPGGFTDTAGNVHAAAIDCIVWYGITQGIGQGRYDPAGTVRRDQMASFLARALEAAGVTLPVPNDQGFADIAGNVHAGAINQLATLGVAQGTSGTTFSPGAPVRRDQLATFVDRAHEQVTGLRLPAGTPRFVDTVGNLHAASIDALAAAEIVRGVAPDRYAPAQSVRRDQMASFLARHLGVLAGDGYVTPPT